MRVCKRQKKAFDFDFSPKSIINPWQNICLVFILQYLFGQLPNCRILKDDNIVDSTLSIERLVNWKTRSVQLTMVFLTI